ncbi:MAG: ATP-binding protein, partial [Candidatus Verstraetearchaeota archaeon]|nr:ATP-binding protein [Candidatus Verstraetearchaeota archaeon]
LIQELIDRGANPKKIAYVNLEHPLFPRSQLNWLVKALEEIHGSIKGIYLMLDEIQEIERWGEWIRALYDMPLRIKIALTGSSSELVEKTAYQALPGRVVVVRTYPLDFTEFLSFKRIEDTALLSESRLKHFVDEYLEYGGFPEVVLAPKSLRLELLTSLFNTIIYRDVVLRHSLRDEVSIYELARFLLRAIGSKVSLARASRMLRVSENTIRSWLTTLCGVGLIDLCEAWSTSAVNAVYRQKKVYACDTGLRNAIVFRGKLEGGRLLENSVFNHLARLGVKPRYYEEKGREVDFVVDVGGRKLFLEVKWSGTEFERWQPPRKVRALLRIAHEDLRPGILHVSKVLLTRSVLELERLTVEAERSM